jgi:amidohydrolase
MNPNIAELVSLRQELHKNPELSGNEIETARYIRKYVNRFEPDLTIEGLGGNGMAFVFKGEKPGPSVLFRCELDALPIDEINDFSYRSLTHGVSHKCGHDGHMAIICGLAEAIRKNPPENGSVVLLFQPAEETGQGARLVLEDQKFEEINPDYVFALHNLPGYPLNHILVKDNIFSSASIGLIVRLKGKTSHASEPEKGQSPAFVMASILKKVEKYALPGIDPSRVKLITPVYTRLGEKTFGTNPGYAEMMFTIRATHARDFKNLKQFVIKTLEKSIDQITPGDKLFFEYEWVEEFPISINDSICNNIVLASAKQALLNSEKLFFPFRWSEDFGHFLAKYPGAIFGLGSGLRQPALHNPDYDFPDELLQAGVSIFHNIYKTILK